jgi:hypothetical protein
MVGVTTPEPRIDKAESSRIRVQIHDVLIEVWDPIGIGDEPNAQDEYDDYIGELYQLLVSGADDAGIIEYLYWAVHDNMGLDAATRSDMTLTVEALRKIDINPV